jgi:ABC-type molybdate transport system substrate-binding protein
LHLLSAGYSDFIMVFNRDISDSDFKKAQDDVTAANGIVNHKYTKGLKGLSISIPDNQVNTFESKDYVKFMEADQTGMRVLMQ